MSKARTIEPQAYVPNGLVKPNLDEIKNGWTAETLTAALQMGCVNAYAFCQERLVRAQHRQQQAQTLARDYRRGADLSDPPTAKTLARLEKDLAEASADFQFAQGRLDVAAEEAEFAA